MVSLRHLASTACRPVPVQPRSVPAPTDLEHVLGAVADAQLLVDLLVQLRALAQDEARDARAPLRRPHGLRPKAKARAAAAAGPGLRRRLPLSDGRQAGAHGAHADAALALPVTLHLTGVLPARRSGASAIGCLP